MEREEKVLSMTHPLWLPHEDDASHGQIVSTFDSGGKHVIISKRKSKLALPPKDHRVLGAKTVACIGT